MNRNRWLMFLLLGGLLLALGGCARVRLIPVEEPRWKAIPSTEEEDVKAKPQVERPCPAFEPLTYLDILRRMNDAQLGKEYQIVRNRFDRKPGEDDRWRLIFLSLWPDRPFTDRKRALKLLGERKERANDPLRGLAVLLEGMLEREGECERKLAAEKSRAETLHRQLEELKKIETILGEREKLRPAGR
ncbi:hypothetical protein [Trichloromonas sp.]|uniref:hypothetical protein n=1 Tax=Trichloromonas sp. TaxID=3069249 RepID=UPI002A48F8C1|nr:hypothetical protein [Trichloromonas sp.]